MLQRAPLPADAPRVVLPAPPERAPREAVPLGGLPPLPLDDEPGPALGHHLPIKALTAIILAAAVGTTLLATALTASIQGKLREAEAAVAAVPAVTSRERAGRGDALVSRHLKPVEDKHSFSAPFTQTVNGQDVIRTARFERLASRLATVVDATGDGVPASLLDEVLRPGGAGEAAEDALAASSEDAEVVVSHHPLDTATSQPQAAAGDGDGSEGGEAVLSDALAAEEVLAYERGENARFSWLGAGGPLSLGASVLPGGEDVPQADAFSRMSVQFIPENVTTRPREPKTAPAVERLVLEAGQGVQQVLAGHGLSLLEAEQVARILRAAGIQPGRTLELEQAAAPGSGILRVSADIGGEMAPVAARTDQGRFVAVALPPASPAADRAGDADGADDSEEGVPLYQTLYLSARNGGLSHEATLELMRLFASDFDLEQGTTPKDELDVLALETGDDKTPGTLLTVQLTAAGKTRRYYRALDGKSGDLAYVDAEGRSFHSALDTKPVIHARLTSRFGGRYHPILHYTRPHNGIDWAAKIGTPIMAAGDGEVTEAGVHSGYGRHVEIRHADGYVTTYSHMDRIARDITVGRHVARGDVIGFLGQSGLATGPHLHFEYKLNGIFVDPLTVKVPRARLPQREAGSRFAAWVQQLDHLATCETCDASH